MIVLIMTTLFLCDPIVYIHGRSLNFKHNQYTHVLSWYALENNQLSTSQVHKHLHLRTINAYNVN